MSICPKLSTGNFTCPKQRIPKSVRVSMKGCYSVLRYRCCHCESPVPPGRGDCVVVSLFAMTETKKCALTIECLLKPLGAPQALGPAGTPVLTEPFFTPPNGPVA